MTGPRVRVREDDVDRYLQTQGGAATEQDVDRYLGADTTTARDTTASPLVGPESRTGPSLLSRVGGAMSRDLAPSVGDFLSGTWDWYHRNIPNWKRDQDEAEAAVDAQQRVTPEGERSLIEGQMRSAPAIVIESEGPGHQERTGYRHILPHRRPHSVLTSPANAIAATFAQRDPAVLNRPGLPDDVRRANAKAQALREQAFTRALVNATTDDERQRIAYAYQRQGAQYDLSDIAYGEYAGAGGFPEAAYQGFVGATMGLGEDELERQAVRALDEADARGRLVDPSDYLNDPARGIELLKRPTSLQENARMAGSFIPFQKAMGVSEALGEGLLGAAEASGAKGLAGALRAAGQYAPTNAFARSLLGTTKEIASFLPASAAVAGTEAAVNNRDVGQAMGAALDPRHLLDSPLMAAFILKGAAGKAGALPPLGRLGQGALMAGAGGYLAMNAADKDKPLSFAAAALAAGLGGVMAKRGVEGEVGRAAGALLPPADFSQTPLGVTLPERLQDVRAIKLQERLLDQLASERVAGEAERARAAARRPYRVQNLVNEAGEVAQATRSPEEIINRHIDQMGEEAARGARPGPRITTTPEEIAQQRLAERANPLATALGEGLQTEPEPIAGGETRESRAYRERVGPDVPSQAEIAQRYLDSLDASKTPPELPNPAEAIPAPPAGDRASTGQPEATAGQSGEPTPEVQRRTGLVNRYLDRVIAGLRDEAEGAADDTQRTKLLRQAQQLLAKRDDPKAQDRMAALVGVGATGTALAQQGQQQDDELTTAQKIALGLAGAVGAGLFARRAMRELNIDLARSARDIANEENHDYLQTRYGREGDIAPASGRGRQPGERVPLERGDVTTNVEYASGAQRGLRPEDIARLSGPERRIARKAFTKAVVEPIWREEGLDPRALGPGLGSWFAEGDFSVNEASRLGFPPDTPPAKIARVLARVSQAAKQSGFFVATPDVEGSQRAVEVELPRALSEAEYKDFVQRLSRADGGRRFNGSTMVRLDPARVQIVLNEGMGEADARAVAQLAEQLGGGRAESVDYPVTAVFKGAEEYAQLIAQSGGLGEGERRTQDRAAGRYESLARVAQARLTAADLLFRAAHAGGRLASHPAAPLLPLAALGAAQALEDDDPETGAEGSVPLALAAGAAIVFPKKTPKGMTPYAEVARRAIRASGEAWERPSRDVVIVDGPRSLRTAEYQKQRARIVDGMMRDIEAARTHPNPKVRKSGVWYRRSIKGMEKRLVQTYPELAHPSRMAFFKVILAMTSANSDPLKNLQAAIPIYENWNWGRGGTRLDALGENVARNKGSAAINKKLGIIEDIYRDVLRETNDEELGAQAVVDHLLEHEPRRRRLAGATTEPRALRKQYVLGQKTGRFWMNMLSAQPEFAGRGLEDYATPDIWFTRTNRTYLGFLKLAPTEAYSEAAGRTTQFDLHRAEGGIFKLDSDPTPDEVTLFEDAAQEAARRYNAANGTKLTAMDVQALLWYLEKDRYRAAGAPDSKMWDFDGAAEAILKRRAAGYPNLKMRKTLGLLGIGAVIAGTANRNDDESDAAKAAALAGMLFFTRRGREEATRGFAGEEGDAIRRPSEGELDQRLRDLKTNMRLGREPEARRVRDVPEHPAERMVRLDDTARTVYREARASAKQRFDNLRELPSERRVRQWIDPEVSPARLALDILHEDAKGDPDKARRLVEGQYSRIMPHVIDAKEWLPPQRQDAIRAWLFALEPDGAEKARQVAENAEREASSWRGRQDHPSYEGFGSMMVTHADRAKAMVEEVLRYKNELGALGIGAATLAGLQSQDEKKRKAAQAALAGVLFLRKPTGEMEDAGFSTRALRAVENAPFEKGTGRQWLAHLEKNASKAELDWKGSNPDAVGYGDSMRGVLQSLAAGGGVHTRAEVRDLIQKHAVRANLLERSRGMVREQSRLANERAANLDQEESAYDDARSASISHPEYHALRQRADVAHFLQNPEGEDAAALEQMAILRGLAHSATALSAGYDLSPERVGPAREALARIADPSLRAAWEKHLDAAVRLGEAVQAHREASDTRGVRSGDYEPRFDASEPEEYRYDYHPEKGENYREWIITLDPKSKAPAAQDFHYNVHWEEKNPLVHVRVVERRGRDGERILHVEEIQSDWAQQGREHGFRSDITPEHEAKLSDASRRVDDAHDALKGILRDWLVRNDGRTETGIRNLSVSQLLQLYDRTRPDDPTVGAARQEWKQALDAHAKLKALALNAKPDTPLRKTQDWMGLGMKAVIDRAVREGFDKVVWTPGEEQAERYFKRTRVKSIEFIEDKGDGTGTLYGFDREGNSVIREPNIKRENLGAVMGSKELANRLLGKQPEVEEEQHDQVERRVLDLDTEEAIGGEGHTAFYGRGEDAKTLSGEKTAVIPQWLQEYARKNKVELQLGPHDVEVLDARSKKYERRYVSYPDEGEPTPTWDTLKARYDELDRGLYEDQSIRGNNAIKRAEEEMAALKTLMLHMSAGKQDFAAAMTDVYNLYEKAAKDDYYGGPERAIFSGLIHVRDNLDGNGGWEEQKVTPAKTVRMQGFPISESLKKQVLGKGLDLWANPLAPAISALAKGDRIVAAGGVIGLGLAVAGTNEEKHPALQHTGLPLIALGLLHAVGSENLRKAGGAVGDAAVRELRKSKLGRDAVFFTNPDALLPPAAREAITELKRYWMPKSKARGQEFAEKARQLGPRLDRGVSDLIEGENFEQLAPDEVARASATAEAIAREMFAIGQQAVSVGGLPAAAFDFYADPTTGKTRYLPRRYAQFEAGDIWGEPGPHAGRGGKKARIPATKKRSLDEPVRLAVAEVQSAAGSGDPQRLATARQALADAVKARDDARNQMGEIREASYRAAIGVEEGYRRIGIAKTLQTLRQTPGVIHPEYLQHFNDFDAAKDRYKNATNAADQAAAERDMDAAYRQMQRISRRFAATGGLSEWAVVPESKGLGPLSGMVMSREAKNAIDGLPDIRVVAPVLNFWKQAKTVFNPGTHVGNVASNIVVAHMAGMSIHEQPKWLRRALRDMKAKGDATRFLAEHGVLGLNAVSAGQEWGRPMGKNARTLQELAKTTRPETRASLERVTEDQPQLLQGPGDIRRALDDFATGARKLYAGEDDVFRVAYFLKKVSEGMSRDEAAKAAQTDLIDFHTNSPALHAIRTTASPFILYSAKALPTFARHIIDHPYRYISLIAMWGAMNELSEKTEGRIETRNVPPGMRRSRAGYFLPGMVQLPFTDERGGKAAFDISRWTPLAALTTGAMPGTPGSLISDDFPAALQPSSPWLGIGAKVTGNVNPATGRPIVSRSRTTGQNLTGVAEALGEEFAPPLIGLQIPRVLNDLGNREGRAAGLDALGMAGLRPRYTRYGEYPERATFEREQDLRELRSDIMRQMKRARNSPDRQAELRAEYRERINAINERYKGRVRPEER